MQDRDKITLPITGFGSSDRHRQNRTSELSIVRVFEFSSQMLRSGVVVVASDGPPNSARLFLRGAPAVIRDLVHPSSLPADFDKVWCFMFKLNNMQ